MFAGGGELINFNRHQNGFGIYLWPFFTCNSDSHLAKIKNYLKDFKVGTQKNFM